MIRRVNGASRATREPSCAPRRMRAEEDRAARRRPARPPARSDRGAGAAPSAAAGGGILSCNVYSGSAGVVARTPSPAPVRGSRGVRRRRPDGPRVSSGPPGPRPVAVTASSLRAARVARPGHRSRRRRNCHHPTPSSHAAVFTTYTNLSVTFSKSPCAARTWKQFGRGPAADDLAAPPRRALPPPAAPAGRRGERAPPPQCVQRPASSGALSARLPPVCSSLTANTSVHPLRTTISGECANVGVHRNDAQTRSHLYRGRFTEGHV